MKSTPWATGKAIAFLISGIACMLAAFAVGGLMLRNLGNPLFISAVVFSCFLAIAGFYHSYEEKLASYISADFLLTWEGKSLSDFPRYDYLKDCFVPLSDEEKQRIITRLVKFNGLDYHEFPSFAFEMPERQSVVTDQDGSSSALSAILFHLMISGAFAVIASSKGVSFGSVISGVILLAGLILIEISGGQYFGGIERQTGSSSWRSMNRFFEEKNTFDFDTQDKKELIVDRLPNLRLPLEDPEFFNITDEQITSLSFHIINANIIETRNYVRRHFLPEIIRARVLYWAAAAVGLLEVVSFYICAGAI